MVVMFALGLARGQSWTTLFDAAVALAIAAILLALPMVVQVVLSLGSVELAKQKASRACRRSRRSGSPRRSTRTRPAR